MNLEIFNDMEKLVSQLTKKMWEQECFTSESSEGIYQDLCFTMAYMNIRFMNNREENLFAVSRDKEDDFLKYYNNRVIIVVNSLVLEFNDYIVEYDKFLKNVVDKIRKGIYTNSDPKLEFKPKSIINMDFYIESAQNQLNEIKQIFPTVDRQEIQPGKGLSHRHEIIIYKYKVEARYTVPLTPIDMELQFGHKRRQAYYTVWNIKGKNYKPITAKELEIVIPHLNDFPNAQKVAVSDYRKLI